MRSRSSKYVVALLTSLSVACGGRGCGSSASSSTGPVGTAEKPTSAALLGTNLREAQKELVNAVVGKRELNRAELADRLEVVFSAVQEASERIPRNTFEPRVIVDAVGKDPARLLEWVTNETRLVPYEGVLRGPVGVLLDRFGNSLDRAMLLAELLRIAGHDVTLARTQLTNDRAAALLATVRSPQTTKTAPAPDETQAVVDKFYLMYAHKFGGDPEAMRRGTAAVQAVADEAGRIAIHRAAAQSAALRELIKSRVSTAGGDERALAALSDHWFVQRRGDGGVMNLDPSGVVGPSTPVQVAETMQPDDLADARRHTVSVRVILECLCDGRLEEREVLRHTLRMTDAIGVPVSLRQSVADLPSGWTPLAEADPLTALRTKLETASSWLSVLVVGSQAVAQQKFTMDGQVLAPGASPKGRNRGAADLFGSAFGGGAEVPGQLTAQFIEYEIHVPGLPNRTERRTLFDWIGAERRAKPADGQTISAPPRERVMEAAVSTDILLLGEQPSNQFVAKLEAAAFGTVRRYALEQLRSTGKPAPPDEGIIEFPSALYALAQKRAAWSDRTSRIAIIEPNILTRHFGHRPGASQPLVDWSDFDIVTNRVEALDATHLDRVTSRVAQGVLDTNAEVILAASRGTPMNIAEFMASAGTRDWQMTPLAGGSELVAVKPGSASPAGGTDPGWWRIDVTTGDTLGIDRRGWGGQEAVEYLKVLRIPVTMAAGVGCMWQQAGRANVIARQAVCGALAMLTINGFVMGGIGGQVLPMIGVALGFAAMYL